MKFIKMAVLIDKGPFSKSDDWKKIKDQILESIKAIEWPPGSGSITFHKQSGKKRGEGSGVKPIKLAFMAKLEKFGWELEKRVDIVIVKTPGPIDATTKVGDKVFAVEWETGNISSSHRAVN